MNTIKILIFVIVLPIVLLGQNNITQDEHSYRHFIKISSYELKQESDSDIESLQSVDKTKLSIFSGLGFAPFKLNLGVGYFINPNIEANIQYNSLYMPLSLNVDVIALGVRYYENNSSTVYSFSFGGTISKKSDAYSLNGVSVEGSLGFLLKTEIGFYFLPSFKIGGIFRVKESSYGIKGVDLTIGWFI